MFLSYDALSQVVQRLRKIAPGDGKKRQERVSGLRHFLACAEILQKRGQDTLSLAPDEPGRHDLIQAVGHVVSVGNGFRYTPDFTTTYDDKQDFAVGANFLTTGVKSSRDRTAELPGRPSPLLWLKNEVVSLHDKYKTNLQADYELNEIKDALALWLVRDTKFPISSSASEIVDFVNERLKERYGNSVSKQITLSISAYKELFNNSITVLSDDKPEISNLFAPNDHYTAAQRSTSPNLAPVGRNIIFYGAPGTGKSFKVDSLAGTLNVTRTVFHPDTQNSDFFGCLKPRMNGALVEYGFSPGPFCKALRAALLDKDNHHFLIIEEINRAPAAAVFGELFQLLDRRDDIEGVGLSTYEVDFPNEESKNWMEFDNGPSIEKLHLPSNLTLLATMNSSDQGVYPLDTAFRRRWEQEYVPLYGTEGPKGNLELVGKSDALWSVPWRSFVKCLNDWLLKQYSVSEDRLLGLWFVKNGELGVSIPAKILLYLWDDLLRHEDRRLLFSREILTYGQLDIAANRGERIFDDGFLDVLEKFAEIANTGQAAELNETINVE